MINLPLSKFFKIYMLLIFNTLRFSKHYLDKALSYFFVRIPKIYYLTSHILNHKVNKHRNSAKKNVVKSKCLITITKEI